MKKIYKILTVCSAAILIVLCFGACKNDGNNESSKTSGQSSVSQKSDEDSSEPESSESEPGEESSKSSVSATPGSLREAFENETYKSQLDSMLDSLSNDSVEAEMSLVDDSTVALTCTFTEYIESAEMYADELATSTDAVKANFINFIKQIETSFDMEGVSLIIRYNNSDGTTIYEKTYTSADDDDDNYDISDVNTSSYSGIKIATLDELMNQSYMQDMIDSQIEQYQTQGINADVYVEDETKLVYECMYDTVVTEEQAEQLEEMLESMSSTYEGIANSIQQYIEQPGISVIVRFKDGNGDVIAEKEYFQS